jgi:hypothetical protein
MSHERRTRLPMPSPPSLRFPRCAWSSVRNPVHAALFLVLTFFSSACVWLLAEAEFLAIALVLVYVGAVMVLFLFVVMMLDINLDPLREGFARYLPVGDRRGGGDGGRDVRVIGFNRACAARRSARRGRALPVAANTSGWGARCSPITCCRSRSRR